MTRIFKPIYRDETLGEMGRLPDGGIVNIGGTSNTTFTVGGRALLFDDGSSTGPSSGGITLQAVYDNALVPAQIDTETGKNIVFNALNASKLTFNANTGAVTIDGDVSLLGLLNGVAVSDLIDHINGALSPPKHGAEQISVDDSSFTTVSGTDVQAALESIDNQLTSGSVSGYEHVQNTPALTWSIAHGGGSQRIQVTIWDETNGMMLPDEVTIVDANNVTVSFNTAQVGRAILMIF